MNPALVTVIVVIVAVFLFFVIAKVVGVHHRQESVEHKGMTLSVLPKTSLGIWSVGLAAACIVLLVLLVVLVGRLGIGVVKPGSLGAFMLGFAFVISDIATLVTGLVSIIKTKERSILAFLAVVITVLLTLFGLWMFISEEFLG